MSRVSLRASRLAAFLCAAACLAPPLRAQLFKEHSGDFIQGGTGRYNIRFHNPESFPNRGTYTVTDTLPTGLTPTAASGDGWNCTILGPTVTCTSDRPLGGGSTTPFIRLEVRVAADAPPMVTNHAELSGGGFTSFTQADDPTTINPGVNLAITKSHVGNFTKGQIGATYTIVVSNVGSVPTTGQVNVTDPRPPGIRDLTLAGNGWNCVTEACDRSDVLQPGQSYPPITATVNIDFSAPASVTNTANVFGGGTPALKSAADPTIIDLPSLLSSQPSLSFTAQALAPTPASQSLTISSSIAGPLGEFRVSATPSTTSGGNWLTVIGGGSTPTTLTVSVNHAGLAPARYNGTINVTAPGAGNSPLTVPVTLTVTAPPATLQATPTSLSFAHQILAPLPADQSVTITSTPIPVAVTATASTTSGGNWLSVLGSGTTPATLTVSVIPQGLAPGTYNGTITVTGTATNSPFTVPVTLTVTAAPTLGASASQLSFAFQITRTNPANQMLTITSSSGDAIPATAVVGSGDPWLHVTGSGNNTPAALTVSVDPTGLTPGTYNGTIAVTSARASNSPLTVPVTLTVSAAPMLTASPPSLSFEFQISGTLPASQTVTIDSTNGPLPITAAVTSGNNWLQAGTVGTTPANLSVTADPTGLNPGVYNGTITVTSPGIDPLVISATLTVTGAPALRTAPRALSFSFHQSGPLPAGQPLSIATNAGSLPVTVEVTSGNNFLQVSGSGGNTPTGVIVSATPTGLTPGLYNGTINVASPGAPNSPLVVPVSLFVSAAPVLLSDPPSLSFGFHQSGPLPAEQHFTIKSSAEAVPVTATVQSGDPWLRVEGNSADTPAVFSVSINPEGLAPGPYEGTILVSSANPAIAAITIPVSLIVSPAPMLVATPAKLSFAFHINGPSPPSQPLNIDSSGDVLPVAATASTGGTWLQVTGGGDTPTSLVVSVNPTGLTAGIHHGTITVASDEAGNNPLVVPVTLFVSAAPVLDASPNALSFAFHQAGPLPDSQTITIRSSAEALPVTATVSQGDNWLQVSGSGDTPAVLTVSVNPAGLTPGLYDGRITVSSPTAGNTPLVIPVGLLVSPGPVMRATPTALNFAFQRDGPAPAPQTVTIESSADILEIASEIGTRDTWLQVQGGGNTPTALIVTVNPSALGPGTYSSTIEVTSDDAANSPLLVPVTLVVSAAPVLRAAPAALSFETLGPAPATRTINVTSSGNALPVTAVVTSGNNFLQVSGGGDTPAQLTVTVNPAGLAPGFYNGTITVSSPGAANNPVIVPVSLTVGAAGLFANPTSLLFTAAGSQTVNIISSSGPLPVTAVVTSGNNFLQVTGGGNTPAQLTVTVNPAGLAPGTYNGTITVNDSLTIPVTLLVSAAPGIVASPTALSFAFQAGGATPANQSLTIRSTGANIPVSATVTTGNNFLQVSGDGDTPAGLTVSVNPAGLTPGTYNGTITVTSAGAANNPLTIPVTLVVSPAPVLRADPHALEFNFQLSALHPGPQTVTIASSTGALPVTAAVTAGNQWLHVSGGGNTPATLNVSVNATALAPGTYNGAISVASAGAGNSPLTVPVTLVVSRPLEPQSLIVTGGDAVVHVAATTTTGTGGNWLHVAGGGDTPAVLTASINRDGLAGLRPDTYEGTITVTASNPGVSPINLPVTLVVFESGAVQMSVSARAVALQAAGSGLRASPPELSFSAPVGGAEPVLGAVPTSLSFVVSSSAPAPSSQHFTVTAGGAAVPITATASTVTGGNWLQISGDDDTPATFTVSIDPAGLSPGTYNGAITVVSPGASNSPLTVPISLLVTASPVLQAAPPSLTFTGAATQTVNITSTAPLNVTATSNAGWLSVTGGGATPAVLTVSVNPAGLAPDTYNAAITVTAPGAGHALVIPVHLIVGAVGTTALTTTRPSLSFTFQVGGALPEDQLVPIAAGDEHLGIELAVTTREGGNWLAVSGGGPTPVSLSVAVRPAGLTPGTYTGIITVTAQGSLSHLQIPVTLTVIQARTAPALTAAPAALLFTGTLGGPSPPPEGLLLSSQPPGLSFSIAVSPDAPWLSAPAAGVTPQTIPVAVNPAGLSVGRHTGTLTVTTAGAGSVSVPVTLVVLAADLTVRPAALAFVFQRGGPVPAPQTLTAGPGDFQVESTGPWLSVSGLTVSVDPAGLPPGTYDGSIIFSPNGIIVPVTLTVQDEPTLSVSPRRLVFRHQAGDPPPTPQTVAVASAPTGLPFTAQPDQPWIAVNPASGSAPAELAISVDPATLAPGSHFGSVQISHNTTIAVALHIVPAQTLEAPPSIAASVSATTFREQVLAPGMIFTLFGSNMGPQDGVVFSVDQFGFVPSSLAATEVLVNGIPVPLLYVQGGQINAVAPFALSGQTTAQIQVRFRGLLSDAFPVAVQDASPGLFTADQDGNGQGAILNEDGSFNNADNPAAKGSVIALFGDGAGALAPAEVDGIVTARANLPRVALPVSVQIGDQEAEVLFAGGAPGFVAGVTQIDVRIPVGIPSGQVPIIVRIGNFTSQGNVTVAVQ